MFEWLSELVQYVGGWVPRPRIVRATEKGVAFWFGSRVREVEPGWRLDWPALMDLETTAVVRQVLQTDTQTLMTRDMKAVIAGAVVVYTVDDVLKYLVENYDADTAIEEVASAALREAVVSKTLEQIQREKDGRKNIDRALTTAAQAALQPFGVVVEYVRLTHFAEAQVVNYVGAVPTLQPPEEHDDS